MSASNAIAILFLSTLEEQIDRAQHLITLIPAEKLNWKPHPDSLRIGDLLGHLLECLAGFCAALYIQNPDRLSHFVRLREQPVNHFCGIEEAGERIRDYELHIREGFALVSDVDLLHRVPTVFVPSGEALVTILLGNLEHLINHKYQLFSYLKMLDTGVSTNDLYRFK